MTATVSSLDHTATLKREIDWCCEAFNGRFFHYFGEAGTPFKFNMALDLSAEPSGYATTVRECEMNSDEHIFDEADAMNGKRAEGFTLNDRHGKQEIFCLMQRVEKFSAVANPTSNLKGNIDQAFARRFQSVIYFGIPNAEQRLRLWCGMLQDSERYEHDVYLNSLADTYDFVSGNITNMVRYAAICASGRAQCVVSQAALLQGIKKEVIKEGRSF